MPQRSRGAAMMDTVTYTLAGFWVIVALGALGLGLWTLWEAIQARRDARAGRAITINVDGLTTDEVREKLRELEATVAAGQRNFARYGITCQEAAEAFSRFGRSLRRYR